MSTPPTVRSSSLAALAAIWLIVFSLSDLCAAEAGAKNFDIPANDAATALRQFARQSGVELLFSPKEIAGARTNPVKGELAPRAALEQMLQGTELSVTSGKSNGALGVTRASSPVVPKAKEAPENARASQNDSGSQQDTGTLVLTPFEVRVDRDEGYLANNTLAGSRLNTALKDTPVSINVFTEEFMKDIGAFNLSDVMQYGLNMQFDRDDAGGFGDSPNGNNSVYSFQGFRVRGVNISIARNYFISGDIPRDTFNVERVEQSRGPNSVLFGIGSAGGVVNTSTKQGVIGRSFSRLLLSAGSYDSWRTGIDVNQSLDNKKGAVRLNLVKHRSGTYRLYQDAEGEAGNLAVKYRLLPKVELRAEIERGHLRDNSPRNDVLYDFNSYWIAAGRPILGTTDAIPVVNGTAIGSRLSSTTSGASLRFIQNSNQASGQVMTMASQIVTTGDNVPILNESLMNPIVNTQGPTADRFADYNTHSVFVTAQLAKNVFFEAGFNHEDVNRPNLWNATQSHRFRADPNASLPGTLGANPYAGSYYSETNWQRYAQASRADRGRVSLSGELDLGRWGYYRAAILGEIEQKWQYSATFTEVYSGRPFNPTPENSANQVIRRSYFTTGQWDTYYITGPAGGLIKGLVDPISGRTLSSEMILAGVPSDVRYLQKGLLGALQSAYFDGRLVIGAGLREDTRTDSTRAYKRDATTNIYVQNMDSDTESEVTGRTFTLGAVLHATKNIDLIYNRSDNFNLPTAGQRVLTGSSANAVVPAPNPQGEGEEFGVAVTLLDGKLYGRAVHYTTNTVDQFSFQGSNDAGPTANQILNNLVGQGLITQADYNSHYANNTGFLTDRAADGYEFSLTANPTKNWRFQGSFSISNASVDNNRKSDTAYWDAFKAYVAQFPDRVGLGSATTTMATEMAETQQIFDDAKLVNGLGLVGNRKYIANFFTRYTFASGALKGAWVGGGYNWKSKMLLNRNTTLSSNPEEQLVWGAPLGEVSGAAGYSFKFRDKFRINVSLNIRNLFDETEPIITRRASDAQQTVRRLIYRSPRTWQLTTEISF